MLHYRNYKNISKNIVSQSSHLSQQARYQKITPSFHKPSRLFLPIFLFIFALNIINVNIKSNNAHAVLNARAIGNEDRIKIINYMPNSIIRFVGHYFYQSIIEFGADETIQTITMGTPTGWQMNPVGNRIFLKPIDEDATTNMTVITNKRMYFFEMYADYAESINDSNLSFMLKFTYPESYNSTVHNLGEISQAPDLQKPENYNFNYTISGPKSEIEPLLIFDDGEFTYFKFPSTNSETPAFFWVDSQNRENIVNYRVVEGYFVVENIKAKFTLRRGYDVICVFNNEYDVHTGQIKEK